MRAARIRPATEADLKDLERLGLEVQGEHAAALPGIFRAGVSPLAGEYVIELLRSDTAAVLVAERDDHALVGCVVVMLRHAPEYAVFEPRCFAVVDLLAVASTARRTGVGRLLMKGAALWATQHGAASLELNVWEFNREAIAFYAAVGMETARRTMTLPLNGSSPSIDSDVTPD